MTEYSLNDLLSDPITRQLMARDGVAEQDIRDLAEQMRPHAEALRPVEPKSFED
jgi:hypothetical protein